MNIHEVNPMIFYFSGTGNSQLAAMQIAAAIGDETMSIHDALKKQKKRTYHSTRPLLFVAPTYAWRIPKVVEQWIRGNRFEGSSDAYFVLTCGSGSGNAAAYAKKLCEETGLNFCGLASVLMPENYIAMFPVPDKEESQTILEKARPHIAVLAEQIQRGEHFPPASASIGNKLLSGPVNVMFYPLFVHDKGFTVSDDCISCGKCAQRCPLNNITMGKERPVWNGTCTHCMACIGGCPTKAIEYGTKSRGRNRHYIMTP